MKYDSARLFSLASRGLDAELVKIEVDHYSHGTPGTVVVGLGDTAVQESKERVRAALKNTGYDFPRGRVIVNLAPADIRKSGPCFDLPIALGMISLTQGLTVPMSDQTLFFGELSLDGTLRHVNGILSLVTSARGLGFKRVFVPRVNLQEASLIEDIEVYGVDSLQQMVGCLQNDSDLEAARVKHLKDYFNIASAPLMNFADIKGQEHAKRALEIAAAGGHNILMNGSPGAGKTMMAKAFQGILPRVELNEALEVTKLYSLAGLLPKKDFLIRTRPFRTIHHTATGAALVGGGSIPRPGEISLAHRGVLFLDEMAEFPSSILELLRQPLEDRKITISRASGSLTYPAQFILCGAMNPCPCGYFGIPMAIKPCECLPSMVARYQSRISGPLLDRIDLYCMVSPVKYDDLTSHVSAESSCDILVRVERAREIQRQRFTGSAVTVNSEMGTSDLLTHCSLSPAVSRLLGSVMARLQLSARSYHRLLKVSRTIADLGACELIQENHVLEALQYRRSE